jgi:hypothetical protein
MLPAGQARLQETMKSEGRERLTLKPSWYWPIGASTQMVSASRILSAIVLVGLVISDPRRVVYVVSGALVLTVMWVGWFVLLGARANITVFDNELRIRELAGGESTVPIAGVSSLRLCSVKDAWYAERAMLLLGDDGRSCLGSLHGRGWTRDLAKKLATTLGVPVNGSFADVLDRASLRPQWPAALSWAQLNPGVAWTARLVGAVILVALVLGLPAMIGR